MEASSRAAYPSRRDLCRQAALWLSILAEGVRPVKELLLGSVGGIVMAFLGGWRVVRRDVC